MRIVYPGSVLEMGTLRFLLGGGSEIELGIVLHLGNNVQPHLSHHRGGESIAEMTVEDKVGDLEFLSDQIHHLLRLGQDALEFWGEGELGFVLVLAALGPSSGSLGSTWLALLFALS